MYILVSKGIYLQIKSVFCFVFLNGVIACNTVACLPHVCLVVVFPLTGAGTFTACRRCPHVNSITKNKTTQTTIRTFNVN